MTEIKHKYELQKKEIEGLKKEIESKEKIISLLENLIEQSQNLHNDKKYKYGANCIIDGYRAFEIIPPLRQNIKIRVTTQPLIYQ